MVGVLVVHSFEFCSIYFSSITKKQEEIFA